MFPLLSVGALQGLMLKQDSPTSKRVALVVSTPVVVGALPPWIVLATRTTAAQDGEQIKRERQTARAFLMGIDRADILVSNCHALFSAASEISHKKMDLRSL